MSDIPNREELEERLAGALGKEFKKELDELMRLIGNPPNIANIPADWWDSAASEIRALIAPIMRDLFYESVNRLIDEIAFGVDWGLVNEWAINWSRDYSFDLIRGITDHTREIVRSALETYYRDGLSKDELAELIRPAFGPVRAEMIATTETTRSAVQGELAVVNWIESVNENIKMIPIWQTASDELVCPICLPRNGKERGNGWEDFPPAHPRCRCWINYDMRVIKK